MPEDPIERITSAIKSVAENIKSPKGYLSFETLFNIADYFPAVLYKYMKEAKKGDANRNLGVLIEAIKEPEIYKYRKEVPLPTQFLLGFSDPFSPIIFKAGMKGAGLAAKTTYTSAVKPVISGLRKVSPEFDEFIRGIESTKMKLFGDDYINRINAMIRNANVPAATPEELNNLMNTYRKLSKEERSIMDIMFIKNVRSVDELLPTIKSIKFIDNETKLALERAVSKLTKDKIDDIMKVRAVFERFVPQRIQRVPVKFKDAITDLIRPILKTVKPYHTRLVIMASTGHEIVDIKALRQMYEILNKKFGFKNDFIEKIFKFENVPGINNIPGIFWIGTSNKRMPLTLGFRRMSKIREKIFSRFLAGDNIKNTKIEIDVKPNNKLIIKAYKEGATIPESFEIENPFYVPTIDEINKLYKEGQGILNLGRISDEVLEPLPTALVSSYNYVLRYAAFREAFKILTDYPGIEWVDRKNVQKMAIELGRKGFSRFTVLEEAARLYGFYHKFEGKVPFVSKVVNEDLTNILRLAKGEPEALTKWILVMRNVMGIWKYMTLFLTPFAPAFILRNAYSNIMLAYAADVEWRHLAKAMQAVFRNSWENIGKYSAGEIRKYADLTKIVQIDAGDILKAEHALTQEGYSIIKKIDKIAEDVPVLGLMRDFARVNALQESIFRLAFFFKGVEKYNDLLKAYDFVRHRIYVYGGLTPTEMLARDIAFPFYQWYKNNIPNAIYILFNQGDKTIYTLRAIELKLRALGFTIPDKYDKEELPLWSLKYTTFIKRDKSGAMTVGFLQNYYPIADLEFVLNPITGFNNLFTGPIATSFFKKLFNKYPERKFEPALFSFKELSREVFLSNIRILGDLERIVAEAYRLKDLSTYNNLLENIIGIAEKDFYDPTRVIHILNMMGDKRFLYEIIWKNVSGVNMYKYNPVVIKKLQQKVIDELSSELIYKIPAEAPLAYEKFAKVMRLKKELTEGKGYTEEYIKHYEREIKKALSGVDRPELFDVFIPFY